MKKLKTFEEYHEFDDKNGEFLDWDDYVEVNGRIGQIVEFLEGSMITVKFDDGSYDDFKASELTKKELTDREKVDRMSFDDRRDFNRTMDMATIGWKK